MGNYRVQNPATGEIIEKFADATDAEIEQKLAAADAVYREWREKERAGPRSGGPPRRGDF